MWPKHAIFKSGLLQGGFTCLPSRQPESQDFVQVSGMFRICHSMPPERLVDIGRYSRCDAQKTEGERRVAADGSADSCTDCLCLTAVWTLEPTVFVDCRVVPAHTFH